jgi:hypothetical protein
VKSGDLAARILSLTVTCLSTDVVEKSSKIQLKKRTGTSVTSRLSGFERLFSSSVGVTVRYFIQTLPVKSDVSVKCVFLYRFGKHRVGGAIVVNL